MNKNNAVENDVVEYKGIKYVKVPHTGTDCEGCVFYDKSADECTADGGPVFWDCEYSFIWKKLEKMSRNKIKTHITEATK